MAVTITDQYLIFRMADPGDFVEDSFKTVWVDKEKGIQEIMAKRPDGTEHVVQSYLFDKNSWSLDDAKTWLREQKTQGNLTVGERMSKKRSYVTAGVKLTKDKTNIAVNATVNLLTKEDAESALNDRYFFFVPGGVHEGKNGNDDIFTRDELVANYKTAGHQLIDWEHFRDEVIGFSLDAELVSSSDENEPIAVAFNGILNRLSPFMQIEERVGDRVLSRDELIRQRFFEDRLAVSMECYFDSAKCASCGFETDDAMEFEFHRMMSHRAELESGQDVGRILIGVDFVGWGIVENPADPEAFATNLRTSDDGTLATEVFEDASLKEKFGAMASNVAFAKHAAKLEAADTLVDKDNFTFASDTKKTSEPTNEGQSNQIEPEKSSTGGIKMLFNLADKIKAGMTLADALNVAQRVLRDYQGDKALESEAAEAFFTELGEALRVIVADKSFRVADLYTVTDADALSRIEAARAEEKDIAASAATEAQANYDTLNTEKETIASQLQEKENELTALQNKEADAAKEAKVDAFIEELEEAGVVFSEDSIKADIRTLAEGKIDDEESLKTFKGSLIATMTQSKLTEASQNSGASAGSNAEPEGLTARIDKLNAVEELD